MYPFSSLDPIQPHSNKLTATISSFSSSKSRMLLSVFLVGLSSLAFSSAQVACGQPCSGADGYYVPTTGQNYELLCTTDLNTGSKIHVYNNDGVDSVQQCAQACEDWNDDLNTPACTGAVFDSFHNICYLKDGTLLQDSNLDLQSLVRV